MANGNHNVSCATAAGRVCECTGCGGSQHGWQGWLDYTTDSKARSAFRDRLEGELTGGGNASGPPPKRRRELTADLARLDVADWLSDPPPTTTFAVPYPDPDELVTLLAEGMTRGTWEEIAAELDRRSDNAAGVKRELANHGWCDLLVALVRAIETTRSAFDSIPEKVKAIMLTAPLRAARPNVTEFVVNTVVDKVWDAFTTAMFGGTALLDILANDDALRALRILAVFICPAPEDHEAVRQHALKPLGDDTRSILTDQTKARLTELFAEWRPDGAA